jgi:hypothetical protein
MGAIGMHTYHVGSRNDKEAISEEHPTRTVSPESLHRKQRVILLETSRLIDELAEQASWNDWKWSYKYYVELSGKLHRDTRWDYYVDADERGQALSE